jgi:hypothetical protein
MSNRQGVLCIETAILCTRGQEQEVGNALPCDVPQFRVEQDRGPESIEAGSPTYTEASSGSWAASRELLSASLVERREISENSSEASGVKANSRRKLCKARRFNI